MGNTAKKLIFMTFSLHYFLIMTFSLHFFQYKEMKHLKTEGQIVGA